MRALENIRVLDLSMLLPGGYCGMLLADFGAEVIKVEPPAGDPVRAFLPQKDDVGYWHRTLNRNKKSVVLDLKSEAGRAAVLKLAKSADVFLQSYRPGAMNKLGLSYEELSKVNPRLIYCSLSGYGDFSAAAAHDINICAMAGVLSGDEGLFMGDAQFSGIMMAQQAAFGILLALQARQATGKGQEVDTTLLRAAFSFLPGALCNAWGEAETGTPSHPRRTPNYNAYRTSDGKYMAVGAHEPKFWRRLCEILDMPDLVEKLKDRTLFPELFARLEEAFRQKTRAEWEEIFAGEDICVTPAYDVKEAVATGLARDCGMELALEDEAFGRYRQFGLPVRLSGTPGDFRRRAPYLGEHNEEVLGGLDE